MKLGMYVPINGGTLMSIGNDSRGYGLHRNSMQTKTCSSLEPLNRLQPYLAENFTTKHGTALTYFDGQDLMICFFNNILRFLNEACNA